MKRLIVILGMVVALVGFMTLSAQAVVTLSLTVSDSLGDSQTFPGTPNAFISPTFSFADGTSFGASGSFSGVYDSSSFHVDISSITVSSTVGGWVSLDLTEGGLTLPASTLPVEVDATGNIVQGTATENITAIVGTTTFTSPTLLFTLNGDQLAYDVTFLASISNPFNAEEIITLNLGPASSISKTSTDNKLNASVPEPATLLLLGAGLAGLGLYRRFRA